MLLQTARQFDPLDFWNVWVRGGHCMEYFRMGYIDKSGNSGGGGRDDVDWFFAAPTKAQPSNVKIKLIPSKEDLKAAKDMGVDIPPTDLSGPFWFRPMFGVTLCSRFPPVDDITDSLEHTDIPDDDSVSAAAMQSPPHETYAAPHFQSYGAPLGIQTAVFFFSPTNQPE